MLTTTKKELIDRIAQQTDQKQSTVKLIVHCFLQNMINDLSTGHRIEFRDFGVFEIRERSARLTKNPRTLERVALPDRRVVRFKSGRLMKQAIRGQGPMATVLTPEELANEHED